MGVGCGGGQKEPLHPRVVLGSELRPERVGIRRGEKRAAVALRATPRGLRNWMDRGTVGHDSDYRGWHICRAR